MLRSLRTSRAGPRRGTGPVGRMPLTEEVLGEPLADARRDVDTEVDLATAVGLGVGPSTAALREPADGQLGRLPGGHRHRLDR